MARGRGRRGRRGPDRGGGLDRQGRPRGAGPGGRSPRLHRRGGRGHVHGRAAPRPDRRRGRRARRGPRAVLGQRSRGHGRGPRHGHPRRAPERAGGRRRVAGDHAGRAAPGPGEGHRPRDRHRHRARGHHPQARRAGRGERARPGGRAPCGDVRAGRRGRGGDAPARSGRRPRRLHGRQPVDPHGHQLPHDLRGRPRRAAPRDQRPAQGGRALGEALLHAPDRLGGRAGGRRAAVHDHRLRPGSTARRTSWCAAA